MQLSTRGRYAVMAMVDLASRQTLGCECGPVCLAEIAATPATQPGLSGATVRQAAPRRAGRLGARPGRRLPPGAASDAIAIAAIIAAVEEPIRATRCEAAAHDR